MTQQCKQKQLVQACILKILNFQVPQPQLIQQPRASENFKNLNERGSPGGSSNSDENFTNSSDEEKNDQQIKVTNIQVNRQKIQQSEPPNQGIIGQLINFFKAEGEKDQVPQLDKLSQKKLTIEDFLNRPDDSWKYVLEMAERQWVTHEGQGTQLQYQRQMIDHGNVQEMLTSKYGVALKKYLEHQQKQLELERNEVMARFPQQKAPNIGEPDPNFNREKNFLEQDFGSVIQFDAMQASKFGGISHRGSFNKNFHAAFQKGQNSQLGSQLGLTLNLDFLKDKSNMQTKENLNKLFDDGDVSMLKEVDQLFQIYTSRKLKETSRKVDQPDDDGFLNTSRYQGTEHLEAVPNKFIANQQLIGNISVINKNEEFLNLESDRSLFRELNLGTQRKIPANQLGVVQEEEPSRIEATPIRGKSQHKPNSLSMNKYGQVQNQDQINKTIIMSQFTSPKNPGRGHLTSPVHNKFGIQSSVPKQQIQRKQKYFEVQLTPSIPPVTPMKLLTSCQDESSVRNKASSTSNDDKIVMKKLTTGKQTPQAQKPLPNNEVKIAKFDYYQKTSPEDGSEGFPIVGQQHQNEEQDFMMEFTRTEHQNLRIKQSPAIVVERNSYNYNQRREDELQHYRAQQDQNNSQGFDRFGNKVSNTSLGIATPMRLMVPTDDIKITPIINRPMSPAILSPHDHRQMVISSKQESIKQKMQLIQELKNEKKNKLCLGDKQKMNQTNHSSGIATKSNTRISKEQANSSNNKSYGSSKFMNQTKGSGPPRYNYEANEEEKSVKQARQNSPQGLLIKKEKSAEVTQSKKKMQSAPRGSRQSWTQQQDLYVDPEAAEKLKKKLAVQNFIENAKKNKFSEWRKSKMGLQSENSDEDQEK